MIKLRQTGFGTEVSVSYLTDLGSEKIVVISVSDGKVNVAATSDLNEAGLQALKSALAVAEAINKNGIVIQ